MEAEGFPTRFALCPESVGNVKIKMVCGFCLPFATTAKLILMEMLTGLVGWGILHREGWEGQFKLGSQ